MHLRIDAFLYVTLALTLLAPTAAAQNRVLITHDGQSAEHVAAAIADAGGVVTAVYESVPVLAATLTASPDLAHIEIAPDRLLSMGAAPAGGAALPRVTATLPSGVALQADALTTGSPVGYASYRYSGAADTWPATDMGAGSVVAVVDTGTTPNACLAHAVIGAPGFPQGFNATSDGYAATSAFNHFHGTHVAGVVASRCHACLPLTSTLCRALRTAGQPCDASPECAAGRGYLPILGQAPGAHIYPVKVFSRFGGSSATSTILKGLDHLIGLKESGQLDVDVVNMSLGGPTLWDGKDPFDRFLERFAELGVVVVASAGNEGPKPQSVASPATSLYSISVAAADYAPSSRVVYEYLGLRSGRAGMGLVMRPSDAPITTDFSARGPTADGRAGPDISALGHWTLHATPHNQLTWASGTSFSGPAVAGGAALLNAWWEAQGHETDPILIRAALLDGADPMAAGPAWRGQTDQGAGLMDVPSALAALQSGDAGYRFVNRVGRLQANVLVAKPSKKKARGWQDDGPRTATAGGDESTRSSERLEITLLPGETRDLIVAIDDDTQFVSFALSEIALPDNRSQAIWANRLELHLQGAERSSVESTWRGTLQPWQQGPDATIWVEDGLWTVNGATVKRQPLQPGLLKLTLLGPGTNESPLSLVVDVESERRSEEPTGTVVASGPLKAGEHLEWHVEVPAGTAVATFNLRWSRMWDRSPTSDVDLLIYRPDGARFITAASYAAPERAVMLDPMPGVWRLEVVGFDIPLPTTFEVRATLE